MALYFSIFRKWLKYPKLLHSWRNGLERFQDIVNQKERNIYFNEAISRDIQVLSGKHIVQIPFGTFKHYFYTLHGTQQFLLFLPPFLIFRHQSARTIIPGGRQID